MAIAQHMQGSYGNAIHVDLAGPSIVLLPSNTMTRARFSIGYARQLGFAQRLSTTCAMEFLRQDEQFEETWYWRYPFSSLYGVYEQGHIVQKQLAIAIGLRWTSPSWVLGKMQLGFCLEPRIAPNFQWGRKMAYLADSGRDYNVHQLGLGPRVKAGVIWSLGQRWFMALQGELLPLRYLGDGSSHWLILPCFDLGYRF